MEKATNELCTILLTVDSSHGSDSEHRQGDEQQREDEQDGGNDEEKEQIGTIVVIPLAYVRMVLLSSFFIEASACNFQA